jgi:MraZ protein
VGEGGSGGCQDNPFVLNCVKEPKNVIFLLLKWIERYILWEVVGESGNKWEEDAGYQPASLLIGIREQMFLGEYSFTLDEKSRMTIPAKLRAGFVNGLVVTRGFDKCLMVYAMDTFRVLEEKTHQLNLTSSTSRDAFRFLFGGAADAVLDNAGRVLVPDYLRDYAGLKGNIVIVGMGSFLEVWDADRWKEQLASLNDPEANARRFASLDLSTGA